MELATRLTKSCRLRAGAGKILGLADGALLAELGSAADLARLLIVLPLAKFLLQTTAFQELFESSKCCTDGFPVVDAHP
jgi:hypothetical protein